MVLAALLCACTDTQTPSQVQAPTAVITVPSESGHAPLFLQFDGSQSSDPGGEIIEYAWDFGGGNTAFGERVTYTFSEPGQFLVALTVTDNEGHSATVFMDIRAYSQSAGYYTGTATSEVTGDNMPIEVIIGANNVIHAFDYQSLRTSYWGSVIAADHHVSGDLSAELRDQRFVFPDGSKVGTVNIEATIEPGQLISGSFSGAADSGIVDLNYMKRLAERPSILGSISGAWHWNESNGFAASVMINERGRLDYSDTNGCRGLGRLAVIDPSLNGFEFHIRWNCAASEDPRWNGVGEGIVFVDDYYSPGVHRLVFAESTWNGSSIVWTIERAADNNSAQEPVAPIIADSGITPMREGRQHAL